MPIKKRKMEPKVFRQINEDIRKLLCENKKIKPQKKLRRMPIFERVNDDVPYLTEEKLEEAYISKTISHTTKKLLEWLVVRENVEIAENYFNHNQAKFEEISFLLETEKVNFTTFIRKLILKHEQAIST
jgi:hypothetical protein